MLRLLFLLILATPILSAEDIARSLRDSLLDASGAVVGNAKVTRLMRKPLSLVPRQAIPKATIFSSRFPLAYRLEAEGFKKYIQEGITLDVNQAATVSVELTVGATTQEIEVKANAAIIETTSTNLGQAVGDREILDLPLNGRRFTQLGLLQPGVAPITPGLIEAGGTPRAGQSCAVNGQRPESNNFLIDGVDNFNTVDGGFVLEPPVDAISEFRILTHTSPAEFGHSTGSTTNIVTRSGTNEFHGSAWEFLRNNAMDAKSFFCRQRRTSSSQSIRRHLQWPNQKRQDVFLSLLRRRPRQSGRNHSRYCSF